MYTFRTLSWEKNMAALSDYLESGLLSHLFRNTAFARPETIAIALTSGVPVDSDDGSSIPEIPSGAKGYARINLGNPSTDGDDIWNNVGVDTTTTFEVYSEEVDHSGYFYPLFLDETSAQNVENNDGSLARVITFSNTFPGVTFYAPADNDVFTSGSQASAGYVSYEGNGFIKNKNEILFSTALSDWGWVSGVAIVDSAMYGSGNLLMYAELQNPRFVYIGDSIKFDSNSLEISLK